MKGLDGRRLKGVKRIERRGNKRQQKTIEKEIREFGKQEEIR